jgi:hypothetical protein
MTLYRLVNIYGLFKEFVVAIFRAVRSFVRRSSSKNWVNVYQSSRRLIPKHLNVDLNDGFEVVFRGYTLVVSGERRVIAIHELEKMLKWPWPIWGRYSTAFLKELTIIMTNSGWNPGA